MPAANALDLSSRAPRRQGMTRQNRFASLHGDKLNSSIKSSPRSASNVEGKKSQAAQNVVEDHDIFAPPKDSSDEDEEALPSPALPQEHKADGKPGKNDPKIANAKIGNGPSNDRKRNSDSFNDDFTMQDSFTSSQSRKKQRGYGGMKNIHHSTNPRAKKAKLKYAGHGNGIDTVEGENGFLKLNTDAMMQKDAPKFKAPPKSSLSISQVSAVTSADGEAGSQQSVFKKPPLTRAQSQKEPSSKENPKSEKTKSLRSKSTRKAKDNKQRSPLSSNPELLNSKTVLHLAAESGRRLGVSDLAFKVPLSSGQATASTPAASSTNSSRLSSPPSSLASGDDLNDREPPPEPASSAAALSHREIQGLLSDESRLLQDLTTDESNDTLCPLCKVAVDRTFLESFAGVKRLTVREQAAFCKAHTLRTASEKWKAQGYPDIDWAVLNDRLNFHHAALEELIRCKRNSFYRNVFEDSLKRGKTQSSVVQSWARSGEKGGAVADEPLQNEGEVEGGNDWSGDGAGYYGGRGTRIMIDNLMSRFAPTLRRRSPHDNLISQGGVYGYVQAVLVPEMATLLVMDDLKVDPDEARRVLRESAELGNIVNEELEDEGIKDGDDDGDDDGTAINKTEEFVEGQQHSPRKKKKRRNNEA